MGITLSKGISIGIVSHTINTRATPEEVWTTWADVQGWKRWDKGVESSHLNGPFTTGTSGTLKPVSGPSVKIKVTECVENSHFTTVTSLPLASLIFDHKVENVSGNDTRNVTHTIRLEGWFSPIFYCIFSRTMRKEITPSMENLKDIVEKRSHQD